MRSIFISYRRVDSPDVTGRITDRLTQEFGADALFVDVHAIPPGVDFRAEIDKRLQQCEVVLAIVGPDWLDLDGNGRSRLEDPNDFVRIELDTALKRKIPVIPVLVRNAAVPAPSQLPGPLRDFSFRNARPVRIDPDFHGDMQRLIRELREQSHLESVDSAPSVAGRGSLTRLALVLPLLAAEAAQTAVFLWTDDDGLRMASVLVANATGVLLLVSARGRRRGRLIALGGVAIVAPWLLRLVLEPDNAVLSTAMLVLILAGLVWLEPAKDS